MSQNPVDTFNVLIAVALASTGPRLLRIARMLSPQALQRVTALHCRTATSASADPLTSGTNPLSPLLQDGAPIFGLDVATDDIAGTILSTAEDSASDLILLGWHRPMVHDNSGPSPVHDVIERARCDVAMLLSRQVSPVTRVLVPFHGGRHDRRALVLAARMQRHADVHVTVLHVVDPTRPEAAGGTGWSDLVEDLSDGRVRLKVVESSDPVDAAIREAWAGYDLIVAGASEVWGIDGGIFSERLQRLAFATPASMLVVRAGSAPEREPSGVTAIDDAHHPNESIPSEELGA